MTADTMPTMTLAELLHPAMANIDLALMQHELIRDEKEVFTVYDDATGEPIKPGSHVIGHPSIGVGRALDVDGVSNRESRMMLNNDITSYLAELMPLTWFAGMDPGRRRAIVNMRHQLGFHGLAGFHIMIAAITSHDWPLAVVAGRASAWYRETPERAERVLSLLLAGDPAPVAAPVA